MEIQPFRAGHDWIMKLPHSMHGVRFSNLDALRRDANILNLFLPKSDIENFGKDGIEFYAVSAYDGSPCVIMKSVNNSIQWCRAAHANRPVNYMKQVVEFIVRGDFGIDADMAATGVIRQGGKYYNVYDLPKGFIYNGDMDLSYAGLYRLPDMSTVTINGNYDISGNSLHRFEGAPRVVEGNFYVLNNEFQNRLQLRPLNTKIGGNFYTGRTR